MDTHNNPDSTMPSLIVESPVVVKEDSGDGLQYFSDIADVLLDRFDYFWGERYEGWDAGGRRFEIVRESPPPRWWQRLLGLDPSFLKLANVDDKADARIADILTADLESDLAEGRPMQRTVANLIRAGLCRQALRRE